MHSQENNEKHNQSTLQLAARIRRLQKLCIDRKDPDLTVLLTAVTPGCALLWGHNTAQHFQQTMLAGRPFSDSIHPAWRDISLAFRDEGVRIVNEIAQQQRKLPKTRLISTLPLQRKDGRYYWFRYSSFPVACDGEGKATKFMNELRAIGPFDHFAPEKPQLYLDNVLQVHLSNRLQSASSAQLQPAFQHLVSDTGFSLLASYRQLSIKQNGQWILPEKRQVAQAMKQSPAALNKSIFRTMSGIKQGAPAIVTDSIGTFTIFLNEFFGPLDQEHCKS